MATSSNLRHLNPVKRNSKNPRQGKRRTLRENHRGGIFLPGMGRLTIDVTYTEHNNTIVILAYGHLKMRTKSRLLKSRVQEPDDDAGQDSSSLFCLSMKKSSRVKGINGVI